MRTMISAAGRRFLWLLGVCAAITVADPGAAIAETPGDGFAAGRYPSHLRMGQFGTVLMGGYKIVPADQRVTSKYFGLRHTDTFLDATLTGSSGKFYFVSFVVGSGPDGALSAASWLQAMQSSPGGLVPDARYQFTPGPSTQSISAQGRLEYSLPAQTFGFDERNFEWKSADGKIQLSGTLAGNGTQWLLPQRGSDDGTHVMFYSQQGYFVEGSYFGESVKGHVIVETTWGQERYGSSWWVRNRAGHFGLFVINYADGSSEFGQIMCGNQGDLGAVVVNEEGREVLNTKDVSVRQQSENVYLYGLAGQQWNFTSDPSKRIEVAGTGTKLEVGRTHRVDESRKIVAANAIMITPHGLCERTAS